ncbi:hypothetical protein VPH35_018830 [Triticum aestivum]
MTLPPRTLGSFAVAGDVFTVLVLFAPWVTAVPAIYQSRAVGRRSPLPNIAAVLSCCVALLYGCARGDGLVIGVNATGAVLQPAGRSKVCKQMSMECMPHVIVPALSLVSTPLWIVYAYGGEESKNFVGLPNCLGLASALLQVGLHVYFWKLPREQTNVDERAPLLA